MKSAKSNEARGNNQEKQRPPSSLSTGSSDSGVFSSGPVVSASQPTEPSSAAHTGPPSPITQFNSLIYQAANLMAVNEQLRKELAENQQLQTIQRQICQEIAKSPGDGVSTAPPTAPMHQAVARRDARRLQKPEAYKTVICQAWLESKTCAFSENCRFAHGEEELRPSRIEPRQNNKYKTKLCDKYTTSGLCPYGKRCLFIHPDHGPNAYIRADKLLEISQRHALADLRDQMESQIMSGGKNVFASQMLMRPSTPSEKGIGVAIGATPVSVRGPRYSAARPPHPSWPLEPSSFYGMEKASSRPISPFEMLPSAHANSMVYTMLGNATTPSGVSGYVSGGSTPYTDAESAAFSPVVGSRVKSTPIVTNDEESFSMAPGTAFDHLAEDMAKHLDLW